MQIHLLNLFLLAESWLLNATFLLAAQKAQFF